MHLSNSQYRIVFLFIIVTVIITWGILNSTEKRLFSPNATNESTKIEISDEPAEFLNSIELTQEEIKYLKHLQDKGSLTIALRELDFSYSIQENGDITGFNYRFARSFADALNIDLKVQIVHWNTFFELNGEVPKDLQTNPQQKYTPTLLNEVDLYCEYMTILPWREKLFTTVPLFPVKQMLIKQKGTPIENIYDLEHKIIAIFPNTSYHFRLQEIAEEENLDFDYLFANDENDQNLLVAEGEADCSVQDSIIAIRDITNYDNLEIAFPISNIQFYGWAVNSQNEPLSSLLSKYIQYSKDNGTFDQIWQSEYGITHLEYLKLIDFK